MKSRKKCMIERAQASLIPKSRRNASKSQEKIPKCSDAHASISFEADEFAIGVEARVDDRARMGMSRKATVRSLCVDAFFSSASIMKARNLRGSLIHGLF
jgi:hypothetical protein